MTGEAGRPPVPDDLSPSGQDRAEAAPSPAARVLMFLVSIYRVVLSPIMGQSCRFHPTCSAYSLEALRLHGAVRGGWLTVRRIGRCQPFHPGGYDPVPSPARVTRAGEPQTFGRAECGTPERAQGADR